MTVETGPSVINLGAENKLHAGKSVNVRKTSILGCNNNFDIISTPSHKPINLERNSISYKHELMDERTSAVFSFKINLSTFCHQCKAIFHV